MSAEKTNSDVRTKKSLKEKLEINKTKVLRSLLASFAAPFILILCAGFNLFFTNSAELNFTFGDFAFYWIAFTLVPAFVFFVSLILTKKTLHNILFALYSFLAIAGFTQYMITTLTFKGLPGDHGDIALASDATKIINFAFWIVIAAVILWFTVLSKKKDAGKRIVTFLLILVTVMQLFSTVPNAITHISESSENGGGTAYHLTKDDILEVSSKENVIVFVIDRFDAKYFESLLNKDDVPYIDKLDGFTYYADNVSMYPRTYPGITSMLTGAKNEFNGRTSYLKNSYESSSFLKDLSKNGYKINLYIPEFYSYDNAKVLKGVVSNIEDSAGYTITSKSVFLKNIFNLSSYFWAPELFKSTSVSAKDFNKVVVPNTSTASNKYVMTVSSDAEIYDEFCEDGLSTQSKGGTFSFIHLRGTHAPATINENCEVFSTEGTYNYTDLMKQQIGVFKLITEYLDELKEKNLYEDATIIITGDHGALSSDREEYENGIRTALLVKESGKSGTPLQTSNAQVSQDNFQASIIKSAGIKTTTDYGRAYWEIPEGETVTRIHYFQAIGQTSDRNITYKITGPAADFSNWEVISREDIGKLYK